MDAAMTKHINETTPKVRDKIIIRFFFLSIITLGLGMLVLFEVGGEIMEIVEGVFNNATDPVEEESFLKPTIYKWKPILIAAAVGIYCSPATTILSAILLTSFHLHHHGNDRIWNTTPMHILKVSKIIQQCSVFTAFTIIFAMCLYAVYRHTFSLGRDETRITFADSITAHVGGAITV
jgi:hypothetical protein